MRFYVLSDLHLGNRTTEDDAGNKLRKLCCDIRSTTAEGDTVLFIVLGDIANKGNTLSFDIASRCLDLICEELKDFAVKFEFVPGNHDLEKNDQNLILFDSLTAKYGVLHAFNEQSVYSCVYENVNFIFADSTLSRDHDAPGQLDICAIQAEIKPEMSNILFCHHALTQGHDGHDTIENATEIYKQLNSLNISFFFHGHVHHSKAIIPKEGLIEIGFGSLSADISWDKSLFNQFGVCYIQDGKIICVERWINTSDHEMFASNQLYPSKASFSDPNKVLRTSYPPVENYIPRKVLTYDKATTDPLTAALLKHSHIPLKEALKKHKRILLLSDAGMGKSLEIQNLAYELHDKMHTFLFSLKNYSNQDIFDLLPEQYKTLSPNRYALLFDGYDELSTNCQEEFEKKLRLFINKYVGAHIVITSRTNFCRINNNKCNKFDDFEVFLLDRLSGIEVRSYLESRHIDFTRFFDIAQVKKVEELLYNPFYLARLVRVFLQKQDLPPKTELMKELIGTSFDIDDEKFSGNLEDHYRNLFLQLESVALTMQLMHKQAINDREEFQEILPSYDARELAKKSGLLKKDGENWSFVHNNFREYLAARYLSKLSREQVILILSDGNEIKPSWINTLGYLTGVELEWDLLGWLGENCPSALVKFESDRVSIETRKTIFERLFCKYEELSLHFNDELCDETELANFAQSPDVILFLIDRINNPRNMPSQYSAINILRHFPSLLGLDDVVRDSLVDCCNKYPQTHKAVCRLCLLTLCQHKLGSPELTSHLMNLFAETQEDFIRLGMYEYLIENSEHNTYAQYFLDGIKYINHTFDDKEIRVSNEGYELVCGLKMMSTVESVSLVLNFLSEEKHLNFYDSDKVVLEMVNKSIELYNSGFSGMYSILLNCYIHAAKTWNHAMTGAATQFFVKTGTLKTAISTVVDDFENSPHKITDLMNSDPNTIEYVKDAYINGTLKSTIAFSKIVDWYVRDPKKYNEYAMIIKNKEGIDLPKYQPPIDHAALRTKALQQYFDILFDEDEREKMLSDLLSKIGDPNMPAGKLLKSRVEIDHYSTLWHLKSAIYRYSPGEMKVSEFFMNTDIEDLIIFVSSELLESSPAIVVSPQQRQYISQIIYKRIQEGVFENAINYHENRLDIKYLIPEIVDVIMALDIELDEGTLFQLTELPSFLFDKQKESTKYEFIELKLSKDKIKKQLVNNVKGGRVQDMVLKDHLDYFCENNDSALVSNAVSICKNSPDYSSLRMSAWRYIYDVAGAEYLEREVIPIANGEFLVEINDFCKDISRKLMRTRMEEEYKKAPDNQLLSHMITLESVKAIRKYVKYVRKNKHPPEKDGINVNGPTAAIESISNPIFLPFLEKLLVCILDKRFVDNSWRGLKNTLTGAFANCGKLAPDRAIKIIKKHRPKVKKNEDNFRLCNYIMSEILANNRSAKDVAKTLTQAKTYLTLSN